MDKSKIFAVLFLFFINTSFATPCTDLLNQINTNFLYSKTQSINFMNLAWLEQTLGPAQKSQQNNRSYYKWTCDNKHSMTLTLDELNNPISLDVDSNLDNTEYYYIVLSFTSDSQDPNKKTILSMKVTPPKELATPIAQTVDPSKTVLKKQINNEMQQEQSPSAVRTEYQLTSNPKIYKKMSIDYYNKRFGTTFSDLNQVNTDSDKRLQYFLSQLRFCNPGNFSYMLTIDIMPVFVTTTIKGQSGNTCLAKFTFSYEGALGKIIAECSLDPQTLPSFIESLNNQTFNSSSTVWNNACKTKTPSSPFRRSTMERW